MKGNEQFYSGMYYNKAVIVCLLKANGVSFVYLLENVAGNCNYVALERFLCGFRKIFGCVSSRVVPLDSGRGTYSTVQRPVLCMNVWACRVGHSGMGVYCHSL